MFTLLFGVGFYIFLERLEAKGVGLKALDIYARRLLWLFIIGVIHAYLIWDGDVLYHYAVCGFLLFPFRSFSIRQLLIVLCIPVGILLFNDYQHTLRAQNSLQAYEAAIQISEDERTPDEQRSVDQWIRQTTEGKSELRVDETPRQTLLESWAANATHTRVHKGAILYQGIFFRTLIMMILGILLYKSGIFEDYRSMKYYWPLTITILILALVINYHRYQHWTYDYYHPVTSIWKGWLFTFPKETLGLAYILVFNGLYQKWLKNSQFKIISIAGKMALTNYIFQSILCGLIFYGYGLGQHNEHSRSELLWIVLIVWTIQLGLSWWWMKRNTQGPLEWMWRKLTYRNFR
ncbi:DUF418 domain-containing protein [Marinoscillum sp.]|uniref:DUF418 domain-containing protein n=1 Tax=Marinoscillum sp. TaxID=2024838 RepID=UPI003BA8A557